MGHLLAVRGSSLLSYQGCGVGGKVCGDGLLGGRCCRSVDAGSTDVFALLSDEPVRKSL